MQTFEEKLFMADVYHKLADAEEDVSAGKLKDAKEYLKTLQEKHYDPSEGRNSV